MSPVVDGDTSGASLSGVVERLLASDEPAIRYKAEVHLLGRDPASPAMLRLQDDVRISPRVRHLLSERGPDGAVPHHPYRKWYGAHWILVALADLDYPPGDVALFPLREQVLAWLFSAERVAAIRHYTIAGRVRMCASMEGNAIHALLKLGLADQRVDALVERLLAWQWPDGGWNCDKKPAAHTSSFTETLIPLRGLVKYGQRTGDAPVSVACRRAAGIFLQRRLFRRLTDGRVIADEFLRLHYPCYWHYDILLALKVLGEADCLGDPRCREALNHLMGKRLADGGFPAEQKYYQVGPAGENGRSLVDWGGTGARRMNPFVTVEALAVLQNAGLAHQTAI